eukprot:5051956-Pleurochrysis_carterae.AAC.1
MQCRVTAVGQHGHLLRAVVVDVAIQGIDENSACRSRLSQGLVVKARQLPIVETLLRDHFVVHFLVQLHEFWIIQRLGKSLESTQIRFDVLAPCIQVGFFDSVRIPFGDELATHRLGE